MSLAKRVKKWLEDEYGSGCGSLPSTIPCAASLAHHGLLGSVEEMRLPNVDLTSVPAEHLASLASSLTWRVFIRNVSGCDLVTILDSVKSEVLDIRYQSLGREETQALVQAMESRVERLVLNSESTLDLRFLSEYNGQGKCKEVRCFSYTMGRYREQLRAWAMSRNWAVTRDKPSYLFTIERLVQ